MLIPHNKPSLGVEEERAAARIIRSGRIVQGVEVERFENSFCEFLGLPEGHSVAVSNGTAALFLALWVLGARGKKVAMPVYACSSLLHAVSMAGAEEFLIDSYFGSPNIDLDMLGRSEADITIIPHMFGLPVNISKLKEKNIEIIEDCAQALGASVNGIKVGLHGTIGIFSFYATKLMTSGGQGGMVVSKDRFLIDAIRDYREFDCRHDSKRRFNFQMTDLQAAIGSEQLRKLPVFISRREEIFNQYKRCGIELLDIDVKLEDKMIPVRYRAVMRSDDPQQIISSLMSSNIKAIIPVKDWELLGDKDLCPNACKLARTTVSLPIYYSLENNDVDKIISVIFQK